MVESKHGRKGKARPRPVGAQYHFNRRPSFRETLEHLKMSPGEIERDFPGLPATGSFTDYMHMRSKRDEGVPDDVDRSEKEDHN